MKDEDIVHARGNTRINMNKARVAEAALGSPPFYFLKFVSKNLEGLEV